MVLTLYKLDASPPVRAVYMVIEALKIPNVNYVDVDLFADHHLREDYLKLNPQHTIPLLTDGDFIVWDSHAIITYLMNKYSNDDSLYPKDAKKRALIDMRLHFDSAILYPALRINDEDIFFGDATSCTPAGLAKIREAYDFMEKFLNGPYLADDHITLADISCVATISSLKSLLPIDKAIYPNLTAWLERMSKEEFYKKGNLKGEKDYDDLLKTYLSR